MATKKATPKKKPSTSRKTVSTKSSAATTTTVAAVAKKQSFADSIAEFPFWRALISEFIATFLLAATFIVSQGQPLYILFAFVAIFLVFSTTSGSYANPAVAIAAWVSRRISWLRALGYIIFEVLGALVALWVLSGFVGSASGALSTTGSSVALYSAQSLTSGKEIYVFFAELLGTLVLSFAFANALRRGQDRLTSAITAATGLFAGLLVALIAASYASGTAILNPAIAASLKALSWNLWPLAVYILAPVIGAIAGFFLNDFIKGRAGVK